MQIVIDDVEQVIKREVKNGRIAGMTEWNGKTVKVLIMKDNTP